MTDTDSPKTTFYTATTLDGFIADEHDSLEWLFKQQHAQSGAALGYDTFISEIGAIAMGWTTYAWILDHMAQTGESWAYDMPAWVFTHRDFAALEGADIRPAQGEVPPVHEAMVEAAGGKGVWVVGGGDLAGQFCDAGLLDEVITYLAPVTLGAGRPLLPRRLDLELLELHRDESFIAARYAVIGPLAPS